MSFDPINDFLLKHSGPTGCAIDKLLDNNPELYGQVFFNPYTSLGNFAKRATYIATAPVFLSVIAIEFAALTLISAIRAIYNLVTLDLENAKIDGKRIMGGVLATAIALFAAAVGPFVNAVDLVGSLFVKSESVESESNTEASENTASTSSEEETPIYDDERSDEERAFQPA
jgi:hypothetical protein